jgi:hypothetical protein
MAKRSTPWDRAAKRLEQANKDLDGVRRGKRQASERTTDDVHRRVVEKAKRATWVERPDR